MEPSYTGKIGTSGPNRKPMTWSMASISVGCPVFINRVELLRSDRRDDQSRSLNTAGNVQWGEDDVLVSEGDPLLSVHVKLKNIVAVDYE
jgi:hypothetical protein